MLYKIESLRGITALIVVVAHTPFFIGNEEIPYVDLVVDFLFILSGLVMTLAYQNKIKEYLQLNQYLLLRLGRLYPLHIFTLLLWLLFEISKLVLNISVGFPPNNTFNSFLSNVFLIQGMGVHDSLNWNFPSWSISTEFFTYLLFYFLLISFDKKHKLLVPSLVFISCYSYLIHLKGISIAYTYDYGFIRCLGGFYLGVFIYRLKTIFDLTIKSEINIYEFIAFTIPICLVVFSPVELYGYYELLFIFSFGVIVLVFSDKKNGVLGTILNSELLKRIGSYSYSIYLLHMFVIETCNLMFLYLFKIAPELIHGFYAIIMNIIICLITIFLSKYSYKYIEDYFRKKSKKYVKKLMNAI